MHLICWSISNVYFSRKKKMSILNMEMNALDTRVPTHWIANSTTTEHPTAIPHSLCEFYQNCRHLHTATICSTMTPTVKIIFWEKNIIKSKLYCFLNGCSFHNIYFRTTQWISEWPSQISMLYLKTYHHWKSIVLSIWCKSGIWFRLLCAFVRFCVPLKFNKVFRWNNYE